MKTKSAVSTKKQSVTLKDLKTRKNPKGGFTGSVSPANEAPGVQKVREAENRQSCSNQP